MAEVTTFTYHGDHITLGQLLKACNIAQSGGEAKELLQAGAVLVNNETETRRGRKLRHGDQVRLGHNLWQLVAADEQI